MTLCLTSDHGGKVGDVGRGKLGKGLEGKKKKKERQESLKLFSKSVQTLVEFGLFRVEGFFFCHFTFKLEMSKIDPIHG